MYLRAHYFQTRPTDWWLQVFAVVDLVWESSNWWFKYIPAFLPYNENVLARAFKQPLFIICSKLTDVEITKRCLAIYGSILDTWWFLKMVDPRTMGFNPGLTQPRVPCSRYTVAPRPRCHSWSSDPVNISSICDFMFAWSWRVGCKVAFNHFNLKQTLIMRMKSLFRRWLFGLGLRRWKNKKNKKQQGKNKTWNICKTMHINT
jgi:hypothetical protein